MSDLDKLKKENKQLKALLKNVVELLSRYKDILKHPENLRMKKKKRKAKDDILKHRPFAGRRSSVRANHRILTGVKKDPTR